MPRRGPAIACHSQHSLSIVLLPLIFDHALICVILGEHFLISEPCGMPPPPPPLAPDAELAQSQEEPIGFLAMDKSSEPQVMKPQVMPRSMSLLYCNLYIAEISPTFIFI